MKIYDEREKSYNERGNTPPTPIQISYNSRPSGSDTNGN